MTTIRLRPLEPSDAEFYAALQNDAEARKHIGPPLNLSVEECRQKIGSGVGALGSLYVIEDDAEEIPIGICGFTQNNYFEGTDVLVQLIPEYQHCGVGTAALSRLLGIWFEEPDNAALFASVSPRNQAAIALLLKLKFTFEQEYKDAFGVIYHKYFVQRGESTK